MFRGRLRNRQTVGVASVEELSYQSEVVTSVSFSTMALESVTMASLPQATNNPDDLPA